MSTSFVSIISACQLVNKAVRTHMTSLYRGSVAAVAMSEHDYRLAVSKAEKHGIVLLTTVQTNQKGQGVAEFLVVIALIALLVIAAIALLDLPALGTLKEIADILNSL